MHILCINILLGLVSASVTVLVFHRVRLAIKFWFQTLVSYKNMVLENNFNFY